MATLKTRLEELITAIGTDWKGIWANTGNKADLNTTDKSSLVAAINEVEAQTAGGDIIDDEDPGTGTTVTYSADKITDLNAAQNTTISSKANDADVVHDTGAETIAGVKTFSDAPVVPDSSFTIAKTTGLQAAIDAKQASDSDLTTIGGLTPSNDDILQRKSGAWANRTPAQVKTDLALVKADVGLGNVDNTSDTTKNSATVTLTNKRVVPRVTTFASVGSPTIDTNLVDIFGLTAQAAGVTFDVTGTPTDGQELWLYVVGTATRSVAWSSAFEAGDIPLPTTTVGTNRLDIGFMWNAATSKWRCVYSGTNMQTQMDTKQPLDSDLTAIAAIAPSNDDFIQRKAGAWTNRTPAQAKTDLALTSSDVGLGNVNNTSDANKPVSTATQTALDLKANDADVVHDTGTETIAGVKTFSSAPVVPDASFTIAKTSGLQAAIDAKAAINDSSASGSTTYSSNKIGTEISAAVSALIDGAGGAFDTLNELADALGNDSNFATTIATALANRVRVDASQSFTAPEKAQARTNIDAYGSVELGNPDTDLVALYTTAKA